MFPNILTLIKYGLLTTVITGAGVLIGNVIVLRHQRIPLPDHLTYRPNVSLPLEGAVSVLGGDYGKCLTEPTKTFCLKSEKQRAQILTEKAVSQQDMTDYGTTDNVIPILEDRPHWHPIHALLHTFSLLMISLDIQPFILEPSMLFCSLSPVHKVNLLKMGFSPSHFKGSRQIVTVGIFERDRKILEEKESRDRVSLSGFEMEVAQQWITDGMGNDEMYSSHFFFNRHDLVVHAVVFIRSGSFYTHFGLHHKDTPLDMLFKVEGAYDNFTYIPLEAKEDLILKFNIPRNPAQFLLQIQNSRVEFCTPSEETDKIAPHPILIHSQLIDRAVVAIQELKAGLFPRLIDFFLWEESLLGWYESCNIFHKSPELNVGVLSNSTRGTNLSEIWTDNEYLWPVEHFDEDGKEMKVSLDCHGLRVNIFICYASKTFIWYHKEKPPIFYRYNLPAGSAFRLCSTEILGQRVNIPCRPSQRTKREASERGTLLTAKGSLFKKSLLHAS
ncbi:fukutin [Nephila pilipes]|uniref:Fukutin n=1 Tax=Nephila pilipes TaxID=299642 RepID=A0A8X6MJN7_NEPPI|nr:fukutin [Nephila pilipes]